MSRYVAPDLSRLPPPDVVETLDFEALLAARIARFEAAATARGLAWDVGAIEADPVLVIQEAGGVGDLMLRARINDAARALMLATAKGADLDHIAVTYFGAERRAGEDDDTYRARAALAPESWSVAGPEGAYVWHALSASADVADAAAYGEEDGAEYADGAPVLAPEVLVVILAAAADGVASPELLATVAAALDNDEIRPLGDKVTVEAAAITTYSVSATLAYDAGADAAVLVAEAHARVKAYVSARRRVGAVVQRLGLGAALKVTDVEEITLILPATDVDPGSSGAAICTAITIEAVPAEEAWR